MSDSTSKLCIDLCSGLGGFSRAFVDAGWEVITVDVDSKFAPTIVADVRFLPLKPDLHPELLLMSPPCERFSLAAVGKGNVGFPSRGIKLALEIVGACLEAVYDLKPRYWLMENPRARLRHFIGKPMNSISYKNYGGRRPKPTDIWGNVPFKLLEFDRSQKIDWIALAKKSSLFADYLKMNQRERDKYRHRSWELETKSAVKRALVPYGLSQAILDAVSESNALKGERAINQG